MFFTHLLLALLHIAVFASPSARSQGGRSLLTLVRICKHIMYMVHYRTAPKGVTNMLSRYMTGMKTFKCSRSVKSAIPVFCQRKIQSIVVLADFFRPNHSAISLAV